MFLFSWSHFSCVSSSRQKHRPLRWQARRRDRPQDQTSREQRTLASPTQNNQYLLLLLPPRLFDSVSRAHIKGHAARGAIFTAFMIFTTFDIPHATTAKYTVTLSRSRSGGVCNCSVMRGVERRVSISVDGSGRGRRQPTNWQGADGRRAIATAAAPACPLYARSLAHRLRPDP